LLHKRAGGGEARVDPIEPDEVEEADEQIRRAFAMRARLAQLETDDELLELPVSLELACLLESELEPEAGAPAVVEARIRLSEGTNSDLEVAPGVLDVIASLDGLRPLREAIGAVADRRELSVAKHSRLARDALAAVRELLQIGALEVR
jgi:hypothetical protein